MSELVEKLSLDILNRAEEKKQLEAQISTLTATLGIAVGALGRVAGEAMEAADDSNFPDENYFAHFKERGERLIEIAETAQAALSPTKETLNQFIEGVRREAIRECIEAANSVNRYDAAEDAFNNNAEDGAGTMRDLIVERLEALSQVSSNTEGEG